MAPRAYSGDAKRARTGRNEILYRNKKRIKIKIRFLWINFKHILPLSSFTAPAFSQLFDVISFIIKREIADAK